MDFFQLGASKADKLFNLLEVRHCKLITLIAAKNNWVELVTDYNRVFKDLAAFLLEYVIELVKWYESQSIIDIPWFLVSLNYIDVKFN